MVNTEIAGHLGYKHKACSFPQVQLKSQQRTDPLESYSRSSVVRTEREEVDMMQL
jgi:hypothetical protein